jgi:hypothetical protein
MRRPSEGLRAPGRVALRAIALIGWAVMAQAQTVKAPPTLTTAASAQIALLAEATRAHLAGREDLYSIALYGEAPFDHPRMVSENVAKALRIAVIYERDWQRPPVTGWHRELVPRLEPAAVEHLRRSFAPLRRGDIVLIEYAPGRGTTVHVNRTTAVRGARHELMLAFLDHWLGQRPVSEEVKQALLAVMRHGPLP